MKRILFCLTLLFAVLLCRTPTYAITYGAENYRQNKGRVFAGNYNVDPLWQFMDGVENDGLDSLVFVPGTAPSSPIEGEVYYDSASKGLLLYTGAAFVTIDTAGGVSLDGAYNLGSTITVDAGAVTMTATNAADNTALSIVQEDTSNATALLITGSQATANAIGIDIDSQSTGRDIEGTAAAWYVDGAGAATFASATMGSTGLVLENSETITNGTNNAIKFDSDTGTVEDFSIGLGANTNIITFSSDSSADTVEYGTIDDINGVGNLYFDSAPSQITLASNEAADDLTIQVTGALNASLDLRSAGTGTDAVKIYGSAGGIDIDSTDDMAITNTATTNDDDLVIEQVGAQDASLIIQSAGTGGDALSLITSAATGDIKINSGDVIDIDAADDITVDLAGAAGEDILVTNTGGSITLSATESAVDAIKIEATTGGIDILASGAAATEDIDITATGSSVNVTSSEVDASAVVLNASAGGVNIDAATSYDVAINGGQVLIEAEDDAASAISLVSNTGTSETIVVTNTLGEGVGAINLTATAGGVNIDAAAAKIVDIDGGSITLENKTAGATAITLTTNQGATDQMVIVNTQGTNEAALDIDATAGGIDIDASTGKNIAINAGQILIEAEDSAASAISMITNTGILETIVFLNSQGTDDASIDFDSTAGGMDVDVAKSLTLSSTEGSLDSVVITSTNGGIDLITTGAAATEDIDITSSASVNITSAESAAQTIVIATTGGGDATETIDITNDQGTAASSTTQTDAAIQIEATLGGISLESGLSGADAIRLETSESGALITVQAIAATGASATTEEDASIQLYSQLGGVGLASGLAAADAIRIEAQGTDGQITIQNILGTTASAITQSDASIQLYSQVGGIGLLSGLNGSDAIRIEANGGANEIIMILANQGTATADGVSSIQLLSDSGGIGIKATAETDLDAIVLNAAAGGIDIDAFEMITLDLAGGTAGTADIIITNTVGTDDAAIALTATAGGITAKVADEKNLTLGNAGGDAYFIVAASVTAGSEDVRVVNTNGTDDAAIALTATAGGITAQVADEKNMTLGNAAGDAYFIVAASGTAGNEDVRVINTNGTANGAIEITSSAGGIDINAKEMLTLDVAAGTAGTTDIIITNTPGTDEAAIAVQAVAGGVDIDAAAAKNIDISGGQVLISSKDNGASAISLTANVGTSETIVVTNTNGTDVAAVGITATAGGITVTSAKAFKLETAVALNDVQTIGQDDDTPDVSGFSYFNTGTNADTIDDFDGTDIEEGQIIVVISKAVITYDVTGGALACGTTDLVTGSGDSTMWIYDGTNWVLISWMKDSVNQNTSQHD